MGPQLAHPSRAVFERLAAELALPSDAAVLAHIQACAACGAALREARVQHAAAAARLVDAAHFVNIITAGRDRPSWRPWWRSYVVGGLVLAAAAMAVLWVRRSAAPASDVVAVKGAAVRDPQVTLLVRRNSNAALAALANNGSVAPGDVLQFEIDPQGAPWVGVFEVPPGKLPQQLFSVTSPDVGALAQALEVDHAHGDVDLMVVFAPAPLTAPPPRSTSNIKVVLFHLVKEKAPSAPGRNVEGNNER